MYYTLQYTVQYMSKVTIYIPAMKLDIIDVYCKENNIARSTLLTNAAVSLINRKGNIRCNFCSQPSTGKYEVIAYDPLEGESKKISHLCSNHLKSAEKEGVDIKAL